MQQNKLFEKIADSTPNQWLEWIDTVTGNPAIRSAALGTAGYFGSKWAYNKLADKMARGYIDKIEDPMKRQKEWDDYTERRDRIQPWISGGVAAMGAMLPLTHPFAIAKYNYNQPGSTFGDVVKPFFTNKWDYLTKSNEELVDILVKTSELAPFGQTAGLMSDPYPFLGGSGDALLGKNFVMPIVQPLTFWNVDNVPQRQSVDFLKTQQPMIGADNTQIILQGLHEAGNGKESGMISTGDIFKGLIRTGVGAGVGYTLARTLGTILAQPTEVKQDMAYKGAIAGAVVNSGILGYGWDKMKEALT